MTGSMIGTSGEYIALDLGIKGEMLDLDEMFPKSGTIDITNEVNTRLFPDMPKGDHVIHKQLAIAGKMDSGKTVLMNYLCSLAIKKYGKEKINIIYTDDLRVAFDMMDGKQVQLYFIDDAMTNASSRQSYDQAELAKVFNRQRHVFAEEHANGKPGILINIFGWQRWKELDVTFRDANYVIFKTGMAQKEERSLIEGFLGPFYTKVLYQGWDWMDQGNQNIKSTSVARIAARDIYQGGVGLYKNEMVDRVLPKMIRSEKYFGVIEEDIEETLNKLGSRDGWEKMVQCYRLYEKDRTPDGKRKYTQAEVAKIVGVRQGYVSESKKKVEAELKRKK
jgi:hypothetical protein